MSVVTVGSLCLVETDVYNADVSKSQAMDVMERSESNAM